MFQFLEERTVVRDPKIPSADGKTKTKSQSAAGTSRVDQINVLNNITIRQPLPMLILCYCVAVQIPFKTFLDNEVHSLSSSPGYFKKELTKRSARQQASLRKIILHHVKDNSLKLNACALSTTLVDNQ